MRATTPFWLSLSCVLVFGCSSSELGPDACSDGSDNDGDGQTDCDDVGCAAEAFCAASVDASLPDAGVPDGGSIDAATPDAGTGCPAGFELCGGTCVDPRRDIEHCGGCDAPCASGEVCAEGGCTFRCPDGHLVCDGACVDPLTSRAHCGASGDCAGAAAGEACGAGTVCDGSGTCAASCEVGLLVCDGTCVDPATDERFCGASSDCAGTSSGVACGVGERCVDGGCVLSCPAAQLACAGVCVDPLTDRAHCGAMGDCLAGNAGEVCGAGFICDGSGACALSCMTGRLDCDGACIDPDRDGRYCGATSDCAGVSSGEVCGAREVCSSGACACVAGLVGCGGECVDPSTDERFCGASSDCSGASAGDACAVGEVCTGGACVCATGLIACGGGCVDPDTDELFCGATGTCTGGDAGVACGDGERCEAGACVCAPGLVGCGGTCIDPMTDGLNCGAAAGCTGGVACGDGEACTAGACVCAPGLVDCGGACIDPLVDRAHCGASGTCSGGTAGAVCASGWVCAMGMCALSCPAGLSACAGGCVDRSSSPSHCGSCGMACPSRTGAWPVCVSGGCGISCRSGRLDCDGDSSNGCEVTSGGSSTLLTANFESITTGTRPSGWMDGCMSGTSYDWSASNTAHSGSRGLMVDFRGSPGEAAVGIPVSWPASGVVEVRFWARTEQTTQNVYILPVLGDRRLINAVPFERTGELAAPGSGVFYSTGTWYEFVYELNFDTNSFRILANGTEYSSGPLMNATLPCNLSGGNYLSIHGGYVDQKYLLYIDDLTITHRAGGC